MEIKTVWTIGISIGVALYFILSYAISSLGV
jgi:hypothetical protein